jgi:hypothetical protein
MSQGDSFSTSNSVVSRRPGGAAKIVPINSNEAARNLVSRRPGGAAKIVPINSNKAARNLERISNKGYDPINNSDEEGENLLGELHKVRQESAAKSLPFSVKLSNVLAAGSPDDVTKGGARRHRKTRRNRRHRSTRRRKNNRR